MRDSAPHRLTERRQAILRQTSAALRGQPVILWRVVKGIALAEVASPANPPRDVIEFDVVAALRAWGGAVGDRSLWVVCRRERSEEHTSELQSLAYLVCRLLLEKKKRKLVCALLCAIRPTGE